MRYTDEDRCIALAGVFQASAIVADIAHGRPLDEHSFSACLASLFAQDVERVEDVFGGLGGVRLGLLLLRDGLQPEQQRAHAEVLRYAFNIIQVERRFTASSQLQEILHSRLERIEQQRTHFADTHVTIISAIAEAYQDTVSTLSTRIQVVGNAQSLQDERNAARVRAVLLGGIRAGLLWHQTGGRRWHLLFRRGRMQATASRLIDHIT